MTEPRRGWVELGDVRLETAWWGPGPDAAPTIVLLHEGLGCVALWRDFPALLAEVTGCGVFAWSRRGYGASSPATLPRPVSYMQDEAAHSVAPVLDAVCITRAILLGHSDGASIAALYAGTMRDPRIAGVVLLAVHVIVEELSLAGIRDARTRWQTGDLRARLARYHADVDGAFLGWNQAWLGEGFHGWDITACLAGITAPVLVVQGTQDPYGSEAQMRLVETGVGGAVRTLLLEGCGHHPHLEARDTTLAAVQAFVVMVLQATQSAK